MSCYTKFAPSSFVRARERIESEAKPCERTTSADRSQFLSPQTTSSRTAELSRGIGYCRTSSPNTDMRTFLYAIAPITSLVAGSFSARTVNSIVTPLPAWYVIRLRASTLPPPPQTSPERLSVCTEVEVGISLPPSASMLRSSTIESHAAARRDRPLAQRSGEKKRAKGKDSPLRLSNAVSANVSVAVAPVLSRSHSVANVA